MLLSCYVKTKNFLAGSTLNLAVEHTLCCFEDMLKKDDFAILKKNPVFVAIEDEDIKRCWLDMELERILNNIGFKIFIAISSRISVIKSKNPDLIVTLWIDNDFSYLPVCCLYKSQGLTRPKK